MTNRKNVRDVRNRKRKKAKSKRIHPLLLFFSVFTGVVAVGTVLMAGMKLVFDTRERQNMLVQEKSAQQEQAVAANQGGGREGIVEMEPVEVEETVETTAEETKPDRLTFAFAGDILFDDHYAPMARLKQRGGDIASCFSQDLLEEMHNADVFVVNNEFTYSDRGGPLADKQYTFRARPETVSYLHDMGVDLVSLANNHAYDYGEISLLDTLDTLQEAQIPYIGAGRNLEEAASWISYEAGGKSLAIIAATQIERQDNPDTRGATETGAGVFRCWNPQKLYETIAAAKAQHDYVVVFIHWGTENTDVLDWAQKDQAAGIVQAGADLIIGNHPHCLQEVGYVDNVPVIYSLGNYWFNSRALDTCLVKVTLTENGLEGLQLLPARQQDCRTQLLEGSEKARVIGYLNSISKTAALDEEGYILP